MDRLQTLADWVALVTNPMGNLMGEGIHSLAGEQSFEMFARGRSGGYGSHESAHTTRQFPSQVQAQTTYY